MLWYGMVWFTNYLMALFLKGLDLLLDYPVKRNIDNGRMDRRYELKPHLYGIVWYYLPHCIFSIGYVLGSMLYF